MQQKSLAPLPSGPRGTSVLAEPEKACVGPRLPRFPKNDLAHWGNNRHLPLLHLNRFGWLGICTQIDRRAIGEVFSI